MTWWWCKQACCSWRPSALCDQCSTTRQNSRAALCAKWIAIGLQSLAVEPRSLATPLARPLTHITAGHSLLVSMGSDSSDV